VSPSVEVNNQRPPTSAAVVIIGSGIQGLCCAYSLIQRGITSVIILESASSPGGRSTQMSAAMLTRFTGHRITTALADSSIRLYEELGPELASVTGIEVEFTRCGFAIVGRDEASISTVKAEYDEHLSLAMSPPPQLVTGRDINEFTDGLFRFPGDAVACYAEKDGFINISSLTAALVKYIRLKGGLILTSTPALNILGEADHVAGVQIPSGVIKTANVVNAAGVWAGTVSSWVGRNVPIQPSKKDLVQIIDLGRRFRGPIVECIDDGWYFRPDRPNNDRMMLAGVGFGRPETLEDAQGNEKPEIDPGSVEACKEYLRKWTSLKPDIISAIAPQNAWSGYRPLHSLEDPSDGRAPAHLPLFGDPPDTIDGYYESCGWGEFGVTLGPVGGNEVAGEIRRALIKAGDH